MNLFPFDFSFLGDILGPFGFLVNGDFWRSFFVTARFILTILSVIFLAASVWIFIIVWPLRNRLHVLEGFRAYWGPVRRSTFEEEQKIRTRKKWEVIAKRLEGDAGEYSLAVIEADSLLERSLGQMGIAGKTMAERLRTLSIGDLSSLNDVWEVHKLRNKITHEPDFTPKKEETMRALEVYKRALEELGAI